MTNNPTPDPLLMIDELLTIGFLYGIQSDFLPFDEVQHRVAGFKHTEGFEEAKHQLEQLMVRERIDELKRNAHYSQPRKTDPLELCGIDMDKSLVEERIAELELQSKHQEGE